MRTLKKKIRYFDKQGRTCYCRCGSVPREIMKLFKVILLWYLYTFKTGTMLYSCLTC